MTLHMSEWPARRCSADACNQGRQECPCPEACEAPETVDALRQRYWREAWTAAAVVALVALVAVFA